MTNQDDFTITTGRLNPDEMLIDLKAFEQAFPITERGILDYRGWKNRKFHDATILKYFGKWSDAMSKAGVEYDPFAGTRPDRTALETDLRRFAEVFPVKQRTLSHFSSWKNRKVAVGSVSTVFGNWHSALISLGLECPSKSRSVKHSDEEYLAETEKVWRWTMATFNRSPRRLDFKAYIALHTDGVSDGTLVRRFGEFTVYLKAFANWKNGKCSRQDVLALQPTKANVRAPISKRMRYDLIEHAGSKCVKCGMSAQDGVSLHIDHILPVSQGGTNDRSNLRVLCNHCNMGRSDRYSK